MSRDVVSMGTRIEVSKRLRTAYRRGTKKEKSEVLDRFCEATGLSRSSARRYLTSETIGNPKVYRLDRRKVRPTKYSAQSKKLLVRLWRLEGMPCGKYMAANLDEWIWALERHGELVEGQDHYNQATRRQVLAMSPATIDRYLKEYRAKLRLKGIPTTKPGALLRNSIQIRTATSEVESVPGFFEIDTVAHCGPSVKGVFARTLSLTDVHTGWIHLEVARNNAHRNILAALQTAVDKIPFPVTGLDSDNGGEFINHDLLAWVSSMEIYFTRSRPYTKNDQAHIESKNNHVVRRYGFHYRYDTDKERRVLAALWHKVCLKMNYFTPTRKPIGWKENTNGHRKRLYDAPATPYQRLIKAQILSPQQYADLEQAYQRLNPAELTRDILHFQNTLTGLSGKKTEDLTATVTQAQQRREQTYQGGIKIRLA